MAVNGNAVKESAADNPLGPWEPTITNVIPSEELTKLICDFLFQQVVMRKDIGAGPAGGMAVGSGAILEVEAKLGRLIDKSRGERLRLPILSETVISKDDPNLRLAFESSMSQVIFIFFPYFPIAYIYLSTKYIYFLSLSRPNTGR